MLDMGIIKVEINFPELRQAVREFTNMPRKAFEATVPATVTDRRA